MSQGFLRACCGFQCGVRRVGADPTALAAIQLTPPTQVNAASAFSTRIALLLMFECPDGIELGRSERRPRGKHEIEQQRAHH
jgi:hypothetical protein